MSSRFPNAGHRWTKQGQLLRIAGVLLSMTVLATLAQSAAAATPAPTPTSQQQVPLKVLEIVKGLGELPEPSTALLADIKQSAKSLNFSDEDLRNYMASTDVWDVAVQDVMNLEGSNFSSAYRENPAHPNATVSFVALPGKQTTAILRSLPFDTTILVDAPASATDLIRASDLAAAAGDALGVQSLVVGVDPRTSGISLEVASSTTDADVQNVTIAAQTEVDRAITTSRLVKVAVTTALPAETVEMLSIPGGGKDLNNTDGSSECTSGFTTSRNGENGISTAKHCNNGLLYGQGSGVIQFVTEATNNTQTGSLPNEVDLQFHRTIGGNVAVPTFYATGTASSDIRSVSSENNAVVGDYICKFGRTGGYRCPFQVTALNQTITPAFSNHKYVGEAKVAMPNGGWEAGDSGGPVFSGNTAKGSISARDQSVNAAWYTPQTRWGQNMSSTIVLDN